MTSLCFLFRKEGSWRTRQESLSTCYHLHHIDDDHLFRSLLSPLYSPASKNTHHCHLHYRNSHQKNHIHNHNHNHRHKHNHYRYCSPSRPLSPSPSLHFLQTGLLLEAGYRLMFSYMHTVNHISILSLYISIYISKKDKQNEVQ